MYQRCPASYMFRYEMGLKIPPAGTPGALVRGTAIHEAAAKNGEQKKTSRVDLPEAEIADVAASSFDARVATEGLLADPEVTPGELKDTAVTLAKLYRRNIAPGIQPVAVEEGFRLAFANVDYEFVGKMDVVDDQRRVRDLKSKSKTPSDVEPQDRWQLSAYAMGHQAQFGTLPAECVNDNLINLKTPTTVTRSFVPTPEDLRLVLSTLAEVHVGVKAGAFPPNRASFLCSRRMCGYYAECEKKFGGTVRS